MSITVHLDGVDHDQLIRIAKRAKTINPDLDALDIVMDLAATNEYDTPLDFHKLETFPDNSLMHDIYGIAAHLNRDTGHLEDCFLPRCTKTH